MEKGRQFAKSILVESRECFVGERQRKRSKVLVTSSNHHELTEQRFLLTFANYDN